MFKMAASSATRFLRVLDQWLVMLRSWHIVLFLGIASFAQAQKIPLPRFDQLRANYPGYRHHGGRYRNHELVSMIGVTDLTNLLLHDTSALRLSYSLNVIGHGHSLGKEIVRLSKFGKDSVQGVINSETVQFIYLPISYGPYLADKYGYPTITKLHQQDPVQTKHNFWQKQGILRVITYTKHGTQPKGHVALWDCNHFHQSKDWIAGHDLLTVEFWESPDSNCTGISDPVDPVDPVDQIPTMEAANPVHLPSLLQPAGRIKYLKTHLVPHNARHSRHKARNQGIT